VSNTSTNYLQSILAVVHHDLAPCVQTPYEKHRVELIELLLLRLIEDAEAPSPRDYWAAVFNELAGFEVSLALPEALRAALLSINERFSLQGASQSELTATLSRALGSATPPGAAELEGVGKVIRAIAVAERSLRDRLEARIVERRARFSTADATDAETELSAATLTRYLKQRFPEEPDVRAENIVQIPGGRSKATIKFDFVTDKRSETMIIRKDFAKDFMDCSVADEYPIVRAVWKAGLPVPEPYWLESDPSIIDGRFIVFARAPGKVAGTMFEAHVSPEVARQFAATMARLHSLDIHESKIAANLDYGVSDFAAREMIEVSYAKHRSNTPDNALLEAAHLWLFRHLDCVDRRAALIHGDASFHNVLADGERVTALLDWELAHAGDPAEDLMSGKALVETIMPWQDFLSAYVAGGGKPISEERQRFFAIWKLLHYTMFAHAARVMFESGRDLDVRLAAIGYNTYARLQNNLARELMLAPV
jgi:aminoglycoside phosphotransferase (APT) family kinase protein